MPNHCSHTVFLYLDADTAPVDDEDACRLMLEGHFSGILERLKPCPDFDDPTGWAHVDWCHTHRGTKWDLYDIEAHPLRGDGLPWRVSFCTAGSPPNAEMRLRILNSLPKARAGARWIGMNPFDDSIHDLTPTL